MIEGELLVQRMLTSDVKTDLLTLFRTNPGLIDGIDGVAQRIGRTAKSTEGEVDDLLDLGILGKKRVGKIDLLYLQKKRDAEIQEAIATYLKAPESVLP